MLNIALTKDGDAISIHADSQGLALLSREIERLQKSLDAGDCEHSHLFTESWGGGELQEKMLSTEKDEGCKTIHHAKIYAWTDEWAKNHGLVEEGI